MTIEVLCACGHLQVVPDSLAGGIANCEQCGKALDVPGLHDPIWRLLQAGAAVGWALVTMFVYQRAGVEWAAITAVALAFGLWLLSRAL